MSELVKNSQDQLAKLQKLTNINARTEYNTIRLVNSAMVDKTEEEIAESKSKSKKKENPDYGKLFAKKDGVETEIDKTKAEFYLARQRVHVTSKDMVTESVNGKTVKRAKWWCREGDDGNFIEVHNQDGDVVDSGAYRDLRDKYQLKWVNVAYVYYEGDVYRWKLSTAHDFFGITKLLGKNPAQTFRIASMDENTEGSFPFYALKFELANEFPLDKAVEVSSQVAEMLNEYYSKVAAESAMKPKPKQIEDVPYDEDVPDDMPF